MNTMSSTPARRVSLRRKRPTKNTDVTGSPVSKKSSPLREDKDDEASVNCVKSQVYTSRRVQKQLVSAPHESDSLPKNDVQSGHITSEEKLSYTPHSRYQKQEVELHRQHSPDSPFICSQLCGTQECEVVWDCNSPGHSKDDLKRMPGGEVGSSVTFIAPVPHRVLFPKGKGRPPSTTSVKSTTAQLDELLDQLKSRENIPGKSEGFGSCPPLLEISQTNPQAEHSSSLSPEEGFSSITHPPPGLLKGNSSEPFDVWADNCGNEKQVVTSSSETMNIGSEFDDSLFGGDELNMGMCDSSAINLVSDVNTRQSLRKTSVASYEEYKVNVADEVKDCSSVSADMFDDDLFNDSVIQTTQAMEDALTNRDCGNVIANISEGRDVSETKQSGQNFKRSNNFDDSAIKSLSVDRVGGVQNNSLQDSEAFSGRTIDSRANSDTKTIHKSTGVNQSIKTVRDTPGIVDVQVTNQNFGNCVNKLSRTASRNLSKSLMYNCNTNVNKNSVYGEESSCSPVLGNIRTSPKDTSPQRRIRTSFRLGSVASCPQKNVLSNAHKSDSVTNCVNSNNFLTNVPVNEKCLSVCSDASKNTKNDVLVEFEEVNPFLKELRTKNTISSLKKHLETKNTCKLTVMSVVPENEVTELPKAPSIESQKTSNFDHDTFLTRGPSGKSLFRNNVINSPVGRITGRAQTMRGPLLRSHSTGNAKVTNTDMSATVRRSNSSMDVDVSREFEEDDELFASLLSVLPGDEELLFGKSKYQSEEHILECKKNVSPQGENTIKFQENILPYDKPLSLRGIHTSSSFTSLPKNQDDLKISSESVGHMVIGRPLKTALVRSQSNIGHDKNQKNLRPGTSKLPLVLMETSHDVKQDDVYHKSICSSNPAPAHLHTSDILDDDLFEDDVLTLLDEVESQYGSQQTHSQLSNSQTSYSQQLRCTQDEIARKKEAAQRRRQEKQKQRKQHHPVC